MAEDRKPDIVFSEPITEIMGQPPAKILRWGTSIMFLVFAIFIVFAFLIKYPDSIPASIEITTENPPVIMVSKLTGRIKNLYVNDKETIEAGKLIAVMETAASIEEVNRLASIVDTVKNPGNLIVTALPQFTELGELQVYWGTFLKCKTDLNSFIVNDFYGSKIKSITEEIDGILVYIDQIKVKEKLYFQNRSIETKKYRRDSLLNKSGVLSESDLEKSRQALLLNDIEYQQVRLDNSEKSIELAEKRQLLRDYKIERQVEKEKYSSLLGESFLNLQAQIKIWNNTYLLISPVSGVVSFTQYWSENQTVNKDQPVLSVVPTEAGDYVGRINLKMNRSGKVKTGQAVNIKLSGYPYLEYGMIRGIVKSKSLVPSDNSYVIEVSLPSGLMTLYGKKLDFIQNMQGTAEIITEDLRLLQKIASPLRYLISKNKN